MARIKFLNDGYLNYYRRYLYDIVSHFFEWGGELPERCTSAYIENVLITNGFIVAMDYEGLKLVKGALSGLDWLNLPVDFASANPYIPTQIRGLQGETPGAVVGYNNGDPYCYHGSIDIIDIYARRLANIAISTDTSLYNSRVSAIFNVESEAETRQVMASYRQVIEGQPLVVNIGDSDLFNGKQRIFPIKSRDNLITPELTDAFNNTMAEFYKAFGVKTLAVDKKERVTVGENESNTQQTDIQKSIYLKAREDFCKEVRRVLGYNITVKMNIGEEKEEDAENEQRTLEMDNDNAGI